LKPACLALFLLSAACGGPQSSPEGTVSNFLDALESEDTVAFEASFTTETVTLVEEIERLSGVADDTGRPFDIREWCQMFCGGAVVGSTLLGDSATVDVRVEGIEERFPLRREGDRWKIDFTTRLEPAVQLLKLAVPDTVAGALP
jgi:hypothetical protein